MEFREKLLLAHLYFRLQNHFVPICNCKGMYVPRQCHLLFHHFLGFHVLRHPRSPATSSKRWVGWPATKHQRFLWCVSRRWDLGKLFWLASTCWDCHEVLREIVASKFQSITVQYGCLWHVFMACSLTDEDPFFQRSTSRALGHRLRHVASWVSEHLTPGLLGQTLQWSGWWWLVFWKMGEFQGFCLESLNVAHTVIKFVLEGSCFWKRWVCLTGTSEMSNQLHRCPKQLMGFVALQWGGTIQHTVERCYGWHIVDVLIINMMICHHLKKITYQ